MLLPKETLDTVLIMMKLFIIKLFKSQKINDFIIVNFYIVITFCVDIIINVSQSLATFYG